MNMIKRIGVFFTSLFLVLSITATSSFADKTILFSIKGPGSGNAFWASVEKGAKEEAKKLGVKLVLIAPPQEGDVQSQINQVEDQLAKGVDAIFCDFPRFTINYLEGSAYDVVPFADGASWLRISLLAVSLIASLQFAL